MSNILLIEDQQPTIDDIRAAAEASAANGTTNVSFLTASDVGLDAFKPDAAVERSLEEQLAATMKDLVQAHSLDLVVLDSDLTRVEALQTHSTYSKALALIGMPTCRYKKRGSDARFARYTALRRSAREGDEAIWIPSERLSARLPELPRWLDGIVAGMTLIRNRLQGQPGLLEPRRSPIDALAIVLDRPELSNDFLGYAAQNFEYFADEGDVDRVDALPREQVYATRMGYWLFNHVMAFPGPILDAAHACAFLNLLPSMSERPEVRSVLKPARYRGPFAGLGEYYWRSDLAEIAERCDGDVINHAELKGLELERIDTERPSNRGYLCMLSGEPLTRDQAFTPDWIPSGATEARFKEDTLDQLGPLAGI